MASRKDSKRIQVAIQKGEFWLSMSSGRSLDDVHLQMKQMNLWRSFFHRKLVHEAAGQNLRFPLVKGSDLECLAVFSVLSTFTGGSFRARDPLDSRKGKVFIENFRKHPIETN